MEINKDMVDTNKRLDHLDLIKSIAILLVILAHTFSAPLVIPDDFSSERLLHYSFKAIVSLAVPSFFMINGLLLFSRPLDIKKHFGKIYKLIFLLIIWHIILSAVGLFPAGSGLSVYEIVRAIYIGEHNRFVLWFLKALFVLYCFFPLLKVVYDKDFRILAYFLGIVFFFTFGNPLLKMGMNCFKSFSGIAYTSGASFNYFGGLNPFVGEYHYALVYFMAGAFLIKNKFAFQKQTWMLLLVLFLSLLLWVGYGCLVTNSTGATFDIVWRGYSSVVVLLAVIASYMLLIKYKYHDHVVCHFIRFVSTNTLGIYLIHMIVVCHTIDYFRRFHFSQTIPGNLLYAFLILLVCLGITWILEKIPYMKLIVKL